MHFRTPPRFFCSPRGSSRGGLPFPGETDTPLAAWRGFYLRLFHPRLRLARPAKCSAAVGRRQGLLPAGNWKKKRVGARPEGKAEAGQRPGACLSG